MSEPTEKENDLFDSTIQHLQALNILTGVTVRCLEEGEFRSAVNMMDEGCLLVEGSVWETVMGAVEEIRDISNRLSKENDHA